MKEIPTDHPRYESLVLREKIVEGQKSGLLAPIISAIAHGRGEAFDYILGEKTIPSARKSIETSAKLLLNAKKPVISVNGNTAVLARDELLDIASILGCPIEINIFYRTKERVENLYTYLQNNLQVEILGKNPDALIPNLSSERAKCSSKGIYSADVVFVPLEDGDRCQALVNMGKTVIVVDLNPFSRTSQKASLTIVDNITRSSKLLTEFLNKFKNSNLEFFEIENISNKENLNLAVQDIKNRLDTFIASPADYF